MEYLRKPVTQNKSR